MTEDTLENLVFEALERMEIEGSSALESVLVAHPEHATALRRRFSALAGMGLVPDDVEPSLDVPERLGVYAVEGMLGEGGMGIVVAARDLELDRPVALKLIRPEFMGSATMHERFSREVRAVARLQHPGIVRIFEVGEEAGLSYLAMERIEGCTLHEAVKNLRARDPRTLRGSDLHRVVQELSPTPDTGEATDQGDVSHLPPLYQGTWIEACTRIIRDVSEALAAAHGAAVLHRDIKASNVMITPLGRVVLLDFGLAEVEGEAALTRGSAPVGSLPYTAPERLAARKGGGNATQTADVYAAGVLLYELLSLRLPFRAATPTDLAKAILHHDEPSLRGAGVPDPMASLCRRTLRKDPARRPPSAMALARDLTSVLDGRQPKRWGDGPVAAMTSRWRSAPLVTTALGLSAALALVTPAIVLQVRAKAAGETAARDQLSLQRLDSMYAAMDELEAALPDSPALAGTELEKLRADLSASLKSWRAELASDGRLVTLGREPLPLAPDLMLVEQAEAILGALEESGAANSVQKSTLEDLIRELRAIEEVTPFAFEVEFALARLQRWSGREQLSAGRRDEATAAFLDSRRRFKSLAAALPESEILALKLASVEREMNGQGDEE